MLVAPRGASTRPTSDRVREALFSILGSVDHADVLDLFAGTGALGIEALSRGASTATFVEHDRAALRPSCFHTVRTPFCILPGPALPLPPPTPPSPPPPPPQSHGGIYIIAAVVLLAAIGGLLCWKLKGSGDNAAAPPPPTAQTNAP